MGRLGRGLHYSVLAVATWDYEVLNWLEHCAFLDFVIVCDEDHDERIIQRIQTLYVAGLLAPVRYIGEREGIVRF